MTWGFDPLLGFGGAEPVHLTDAEIASWVSQRLGGDCALTRRELARMDRHFDRCCRCWSAALQVVALEIERDRQRRAGLAC